jgi:drug/metabolite transporter (DMT)-like permease
LLAKVPAPVGGVFGGSTPSPVTASRPTMKRPWKLGLPHHTGAVLQMSSWTRYAIIFYFHGGFLLIILLVYKTQKQVRDVSGMASYFKLTIACIIWGVGWTAARYGVVQIGPYLTGEYRFLLSFLFFLPFLFYPKPIKPSFKTFVYMIPLALTGFYLNNLVGYIALNYTTGTTASIIVMSNPLNIAVLSYFFLKDRLNAVGIFSIVLSVAGALIVVVKGDFMSIVTMDVNVGNLLILWCALSWSIYSILVKMFEDKITSIENVTYGSLFAAVGFLPFSLEPVSAGSMTVAVAGSLIFLSLFNTNLAFYFWSEGIKDANPNTAAVFFGLIPLAAAITENIVFGERIALYHIIGAALIFLGILLYVITKRKGLGAEVLEKMGSTREI